jgi:hypothetical protein
MSTDKIELRTLNTEEAYDRAERLENRTREDREGVTVFRGVDRDWGLIYIIIPDFFNPYVLPLAIQDF